MSKPHNGTMSLSDINEWYFYPGKSKEGMLLPDLCQTWMDTGKFFNMMSKFKTVCNKRNQASLRDCVLWHNSANGLKSLVSPTSLTHDKMGIQDKAIWDATYDEEYDGLVSLPTWEVISEEQYHHLSKGKLALPTTAIITIIFDENNHPKHAKPFSCIGQFGLSYMVQRGYSCSFSFTTWTTFINIFKGLSSTSTKELWC